MGRVTIDDYMLFISECTSLLFNWSILSGALRYLTNHSYIYRGYSSTKKLYTPRCSCTTFVCRKRVGKRHRKWHSISRRTCILGVISFPTTTIFKLIGFSMSFYAYPHVSLGKDSLPLVLVLTKPCSCQDSPRKTSDTKFIAT